MKRLITPFQRFFELQTSGSIVLFVATIAALIFANSGLAGFYESLWSEKFTVGFSHFNLSKPLILWINDGLMAIFFFVIGLEIKREILIGELNRVRKAMLPVFAAVGGMVVPVAIFFLMNRGGEGADGWGIPMATDIAFTLGILKILGPRVPLGLKIFLTAYAIIDDLGAVLVIAIFYTSGVEWVLVLSGLGIIAVLGILGSRGIYSRYLYLIAGIVVWVLFLKSGIHPTIAGILMGLTIPISRKINISHYYEKMKLSLESLKHQPSEQEKILSDEQLQKIDNIESLTSKTQSPLQQLENVWHGWVIFFIIPIFAFANAGVDLRSGFSPESIVPGLNIAVAMVAGKAIGISLFAFLALRLGIASLPLNVRFIHIVGVGFLGGLGFTMALFIAMLAYSSPELISVSKAGILAGSLVAGLAGYIILKISLSKNPIGEAEEE